MLDFLTAGRRDRPRRGAAEALYAAAVAQARRPEFYSRLDVPDTLDGRFDLILLHVYLLCRRLTARADGRAAAQALFDTMFGDMDRNLREMGVGDPSIPRRIKAMIQAFYGRRQAYDEALAGSDAALATAIARNVYNGENPPGAVELAGYVRRAAAAVDRADRGALLAGKIDFPPVLPAAGARADGQAA
jgi:cytochrome b pre-mRNA-processing protein 3